MNEVFTNGGYRAASYNSSMLRCICDRGIRWQGLCDDEKEPIDNDSLLVFNRMPAVNGPTAKSPFLYRKKA